MPNIAEYREIPSSVDVNNPLDLVGSVGLRIKKAILDYRDRIQRAYKLRSLESKLKEVNKQLIVAHSRVVEAERSLAKIKLEDLLLRWIKRENKNYFEEPNHVAYTHEHCNALKAMIPFWLDVKFSENTPTMEEIKLAFRPFVEICEREGNDADEYKSVGGGVYEVINDELKLYEVKTHELLDGLSDRILKSARGIVKPKGEPVVVVEIGAGDGKLSHCLQKYCDKKLPGKIKIIATDQKGENYKFQSVMEVFPVETMENLHAIQEYNPDIIINSWMPLGVDFSAEWRQFSRQKHSNLKEYILIGESEEGCTGSDETHRGWSRHRGSRHKGKRVLTEREGFMAKYLDIPTYSRTGRTHVTSFRKVK